MRGTTHRTRQHRRMIRQVRGAVGGLLGADLVGADCPADEYDDVVDRAIAVLNADRTDLVGAVDALAAALDESRGETMSPGCRRDVLRYLEGVAARWPGGRPGGDRQPARPGAARTPVATALHRTIADIPGVADVEVTPVAADREDLRITFRDPTTDDLLLWHHARTRQSRVFFLEVRADLDDETAVLLVACLASGRYQAIDQGRALLVTIDGVETVVA